MPLINFTLSLNKGIINLKRYIRILSVDVEPMTLTKARIVTYENLRPELDPQQVSSGYLVIYSSHHEWLTEEEFTHAHFIDSQEEALA